MNMLRVLFIFTILILFFVNAQAQCDAKSQNFVQEPFGVFPNEQEGFKFFGEGKLSSLRLGVSTREDVARIFGKPVRIVDNEEFFEYDSDWSMAIYYLNKKAPYSMGAIDNPFSGTYRSEINFSTAPEYIGTIYMIRLRTQKKKTFNQKLNSEIFLSQPTKDIFEYMKYRDVYGLSYNVFEKFLDEKQANKFPYSKGDVVEIEYHIECPVQRKIFIEDNSSKF